LNRDNYQLTMLGYLPTQGYNVERTPVSVFNPQHPDFIHKDNPEYMQKMAGMGRGRGKPPA